MPPNGEKQRGTEWTCIVLAEPWTSTIMYESTRAVSVLKVVFYFRVSPRLPFWMPCNATCCFQMKLFLVPQWVLVLMLASTSKPLNYWCFWSDGSYPEIDRIGLPPTFSQVFFFFCICWHCVLYIISFDACAHENPSLRKPKFGALRLLSWPSPDIMGSSPPMPPSIQQFLPRRKDCGR